MSSEKPGTSSSPADGPASTPRASPARAASADVETITDVRTMRALAHPLRISILEALMIGGAMTATQVGEQIGESPTTCSFHLRQLAKYGFVEEAGGGQGRARPWRPVARTMALPAVHDDPAAALAADEVERLWRERMLHRYRTWHETRRAYPRRWQEAAMESEVLTYMTVEEMEQLGRELHELATSRFRGRSADASTRPPDAVAVELVLFSYPLAAPAAAGKEGQTS